MRKALQNNQQTHRKIRSFVKREGRLTPGQERALQQLLPEAGIDHLPGTLNFSTLFSREAETVLEIGFGMGQSLLIQAEANSHINYLGIEVHRPGVGSLLNGMKELALSNIRVSCEDAVEVLEQKIPEQSLAGVQLFFPDPWHKKRHHKRRLVQKPFVESVFSRLKPGGFFHLATDWENYADQMQEVVSGVYGFEQKSSQDAFMVSIDASADSRPLTKFERRGQRLGHGIWDLIFIRKSDKN